MKNKKTLPVAWQRFRVAVICALGLFLVAGAWSFRQNHLERALADAVMQDSEANAHSLLEQGANPNGLLGQESSTIDFFALLNQLLVRPSNKLAIQPQGHRRSPAGIHHSVLMQAATSSSSQITRDLLAHGADIRFRVADGRTALHFAARAPTSENTRLLLEQGADPKAQTVSGDTALHVAVRSPGGFNIAALVQHGADINARNGAGVTPLQAAVQAQAFRAVLQLLQLGADSSDLFHNASDSALDWVAARQSDESQALLVRLWEKEMSAAQRSRFGAYLLIAAVGAGNSPGVDYLLLHGVPVNSVYRHVVTRNSGGNFGSPSGAGSYLTASPGDTPLLVASMGRNKEIIRRLLSAGADVNAVNAAGETPLHRAMFYANIDICRLFLEHGARVTASRPGVDPPLLTVLKQQQDLMANYTGANVPVFISKQSAENRQRINLLIEYGANFTDRNANGDTSLMYTTDDPEFVALLLRRGVDVNASNLQGETALIRCSRLGYDRAVAALIAAGARIDQADNSGRTALMAATVGLTGFSNVKTVKLLLQLGANPNVRDKTGKTALGRLGPRPTPLTAQAAAILVKAGGK